MYLCAQLPSKCTELTFLFVFIAVKLRFVYEKFEKQEIQYTQTKKKHTSMNIT